MDRSKTVYSYKDCKICSFAKCGETSKAKTKKKKCGKNSIRSIDKKEEKKKKHPFFNHYYFLRFSQMFARLIKACMKCSYIRNTLFNGTFFTSVELSSAARNCTSVQ